MLGQLAILAKILGLAVRQIYLLLSQAISPRIHRLTYRPVDTPRNVVIVGASFAGYHAARCLATSLPSGWRVVVIEKSSHFQLTWVLPRFSVVKGHEHKAFIPYGPYLAPCHPASYLWVTDTVEQIVPQKDTQTSGGGSVLLRSGDSIPYDYLLLATGASASLPSRTGQLTKTDAMEVLIAQQDRFAAAKDIVVVGGGAAGIELAADAKSKYPEKTVTLVHSRERLLNRTYGDKLATQAKKDLEGMGVVLKLGQRVLTSESEASGSREVALSSGARIPCDLLMKCVGQRANSGILETLAPQAIADSKHIKVRATLQIADSNPACERVFAAGDIIELDAIQNGRTAVEQGQHAAGNIARAVRGRKLVEYRRRWWEGLTKLNLGLERMAIWAGDGNAEVLLAGKNGKEELDAAMVWRIFGAKPYVDEQKEV